MKFRILVYLYLTLFISIPLDSSAQYSGTEYIDSLLQTLPINAYEGDGKLEIIKENISALDYAAKIKRTIAIGDYYLSSEINDSARVFYTKGLDLAEKGDNIYYKALSFMKISRIHQIYDEYELSLEKLNFSLEFALQTDSLELISTIYRIYGNNFWGMEIYDYALENYFKSLKISEENHYIRNIAAVYNNIGNVYLRINDSENSMKFYRKAFKIANEKDYKWIIAVSANNLGSLMTFNEEYDSALQFFKISREESQVLGGKLHEGITLFNMGNVYIKQDSIETAKKYFLESIDLAYFSHNKIGISNCLIKLGEVELKSGNLSAANSYISSGLTTTQELVSFILQEEALLLKTEYFKKTGQIDSAVICLSKLLIVKDSLSSIENSAKITRLEYKYKEKQAALEIMLLKKETRNTKFTTLVISLGLGAFLIILTFFLMNSRKRNRELEKKNVIIESHQNLLKKKNEELILSQGELKKMVYGKDKFITILSHDLKNPISAIRGFVELMITEFDKINNTKKILFLKEIFKSTEKISLLLDNILYWINSQNAGIKNIPENFNLHKRISENISLYKIISSGKKITLFNNTNVEDQVFTDMNIFDTIIRNLLSNSLKFTEPGGEITFKSERKQDFVYVEIEDTGTGISQEELTKIFNSNNSHSTAGTSNEQGTGLGLNLVLEFSKILDADFNIISKEGLGTKFILKFKLSKK